MLAQAAHKRVSVTTMHSNRIAVPHARSAVRRVAAHVPASKSPYNGQTVKQRIGIIARGAVEQITQEQLEVVIADQEKPIVIDFFATWCGPCVMLAKELEKVAGELGDKVKIVKVDVDQNQELASQLQISGLPTMIFIGTDRSKPALRTEGLLPAETIKDIVSKEL